MAYSAGGDWSEAQSESRLVNPSSLRTRSAWLIALPLVVAGSLTAHALAYRLIGQSAEGTAALLAETGHEYLDQLPVGAVIGLITLLFGLIGVVTERRQLRRTRSTPLWVFAVLPLVGYTTQEHLERFAHTGVPPTDLLFSPLFLVGLALQVPFVVVAWLICRLLLRTVAAIQALLTGSPVLRRRTPPSLLTKRPHLRTRDAVAVHLAPRGPPNLLAVQR